MRLMTNRPLFALLTLAFLALPVRAALEMEVRSHRHRRRPEIAGHGVDRPFE